MKQLKELVVGRSWMVGLGAGVAALSLGVTSQAPAGVVQDAAACIFNSGEVISSSQVNGCFAELFVHKDRMESLIRLNTDEGYVGVGGKAEAPFNIFGTGENHPLVLGIPNQFASGTGLTGIEFRPLQGDGNQGGWGRISFQDMRANNDASYAADMMFSLRGPGTGSPSEAMRIKANGRVGIGTDAPAERLEVAGNVLADAHMTSSDRRLKTDIAPLADSLARVECLEGVSYRMKKGPDTRERQVGLIAQDVERCFPEVVSTDAVGMKSVAYDRLVAPLVEAVKIQQGLIEEQAAAKAELERSVAAQAERLERLEARLSALE